MKVSDLVGILHEKSGSHTAMLSGCWQGGAVPDRKLPSKVIGQDLPSCFPEQ